MCNVNVYVLVKEDCSRTGYAFTAWPRCSDSEKTKIIYQPFLDCEGDEKIFFVYEISGGFDQTQALSL